jgi:replicative DNA helicase
MSGPQKKCAGFDRLPPHSIEAEQGVLACCLLSPADCVPETVGALKGASAFYDLRHQRLMNELVVMQDKGIGIDAITVMNSLGPDIEKIGGLAYLSELPDKVPSAANLGYYLKILREKYLQRRMLAVCAAAQEKLLEPGEEEVMDVLDGVERDILQVNMERTESKDLDWKSVILKVIDNMEEYHRGQGQLRGLSTGFDYFDKMTSGLGQNQLIILGGRPGMGKTSLAFNMVDHLIVNCKVPVGMFSIEMTGDELGSRAVFQHARSDYQRYRTGFLQSGDIPRITSACAALANAPMFLDESSPITAQEIRAKARRWVRQNGVRMVVIDYLQLVRYAGPFREKRDQVGEISHQLKGMAKELRIPVVVLCQLNRESEKDSRVPQMSDLRDSGEIEQDADLIGILYKPKLSKEEEEMQVANTDWAAHSERVNMQICKQRNGPTGRVELLFEKACMRFSSYKQAQQTNKEPKYSNKAPTDDELAGM